jgi:hypothetical protein
MSNDYPRLLPCARACCAIYRAAGVVDEERSAQREREGGLQRPHTVKV